MIALTLAHLRLVLVSLSLAYVLGVGIGVFASLRPTLGRALVLFSSLIQTVPAIAFLAGMVPLLAWVAARTGAPIPAIGELPALLALTSYALLPIVRGTLEGLASVDPAVRLAARSVGMTEREELLEVGLPLASGSILSGLRTAASWTVGMATLATPVGGTSLGNLIFSGLQTRRPEDIVLGCVLAAAMAIVLDRALAWPEARARGQTERRTRPLAILGAVLFVLSLAAALTVGIGASGASPSVRIGAKSFTEQLVLAEVLRCVAEGAGESAEVRPSLGTTVAFDALVAGELDVYVEYTGTAWTTLLHHDALLARDDTDALVAELEDRYGVTTLARLGFENAYAVVVRRDDPARSIEALAARRPRVGGDYEVFSRDEWRALALGYGLGDAETVVMDPSLLYEALATGELDAILGYTTDGRIEALGLRVLLDERSVLPPYEAIVLGRPGLLSDDPALVDALRELTNSIDAEWMRSANDAVDGHRRTPGEAAASHPACH
jgi:osmoprotectant transport system permease protein